MSVKYAINPAEIAAAFDQVKLPVVFYKLTSLRSCSNVRSSSRTDRGAMTRICAADKCRDAAAAVPG